VVGALRVKSGFALVISLVTAFAIAEPAAAALTSVVEDPIGDLLTQLPNGPNPAFVAQAYQDILRATVTLKHGQFILTMKLAAPIPESPILPPQIELIEWDWTFNTNLTAFPAGFPFPGPIDSSEFMVFVIWNGVSFSAILIDRRPLLTGGDALLTPVPFQIKGSDITVSVDAALLDNPSSFPWRTFTEIWQAQLGTNSWMVADEAPDLGLAAATWPA